MAQARLHWCLATSGDADSCLTTGGISYLSEVAGWDRQFCGQCARELPISLSHAASRACLRR